MKKILTEGLTTTYLHNGMEPVSLLLWNFFFFNVLKIKFFNFSYFVVCDTAIFLFVVLQSKRFNQGDLKYVQDQTTYLLITSITLRSRLSNSSSPVGRVSHKQAGLRIGLGLVLYAASVAPDPTHASHAACTASWDYHRAHTSYHAWVGPALMHTVGNTGSRSRTLRVTCTAGPLGCVQWVWRLDVHAASQAGMGCMLPVARGMDLVLSKGSGMWAVFRAPDQPPVLPAVPTKPGPAGLGLSLGPAHGVDQPTDHMYDTCALNHSWRRNMQIALEASIIVQPSRYPSKTMRV